MATDKESFVIRNQSDLASALGSLSGLKPSADDPYTVTVSKEDENRSLK